jgi:sulfotransferase
MSRKFHFISGLPRSGSTLLAGLLRQNPDFHADMSSALGPLVAGNIDMMSAGSEVSLLLKEEQKPALLRSLFETYRQTVTDCPVLFDTNRIWSARLPLIRDLYPEAKVIACVRDVPWIMDSLERLYRRDPYENTRLFGDGRSATVYSRVETLAQHNRLVGYAWTALKEGFYSEQSSSLMVVEYDLLASTPEKTLRLIYEFLDEPYFSGHDFENVDYDAPEFDTALGVKGLHKVRPVVSLEPRKTILPPDLFKKYEGMDFWRDTTGSQASLIARKKPGPVSAGAKIAQKLRKKGFKS